jgi:hypothetical protein
MAGADRYTGWQLPEWRLVKKLNNSLVRRGENREPEASVELNHSGDRGPGIAIEAICELITDIFAALPKRFMEREDFDALIQVPLRHPAIQCELAPDSAVQRRPLQAEQTPYSIAPGRWLSRNMPLGGMCSTLSAGPGQ